ncbi:MAG: tRNA lysidine(34) synthetase TilS [Clostridia bacterium]|nr:tRNA lysidine(34) synthetase TilS [Clostridia bacterium]
MMREQFEENLRRLGVRPGSICTVALSGGRDSVVLLHLLKGLELSLRAVHIHHGLRGESADRDAQFCEELCRKWQIPCTILKGDARAYGKARGMSLEEGARAMRYEMLAPYQEEGFLATAHHGDDHAETFFINLYRGSGSAGLSGIPEKRGNLIRPLLPFSRAQISAYAKEEGLSFCMDETNEDSAFLRNFIRKEILPRLNERAEGNFTKGLLASMENLRKEQEALDQWASRIEKCEKDSLKDLPDAVLKRVLDRLNGKPLDRLHFELIANLLRGDALHGQVQMEKDRYFRMEYGRCLFLSKEQEREFPIGLGERVYRGDTMFSIQPWEINTPFTHFSIDCDKIRGNLIFRHRREGDRFCPQGREGSSHLAKRLKNDRLPKSKRDRLWILAEENGRVLWAEGYGADQSAACDGTTKRAYCVEIMREGK